MKELSNLKKNYQILNHNLVKWIRHLQVDSKKQKLELLNQKENLVNGRLVTILKLVIGKIVITPKLASGKANTTERSVI